MKESTRITREYLFTQKELKEKLKISGNIQNFVLHSGLSPLDEEKGISRDKSIFEIKTVETKEEKS